MGCSAEFWAAHARAVLSRAAHPYGVLSLFGGKVRAAQPRGVLSHHHQRIPTGLIPMVLNFCFAALAVISSKEVQVSSSRRPCGLPRRRTVAAASMGRKTAAQRGPE